MADLNTPEDACSEVAAVVKSHQAQPQNLLQILVDLQQKLGWLAPGVITGVARALNISRARVEGVAGFYSFLHTEPAGRYRVLFADNIIERMQGAPALMERLCHALWLQPGKISEDGLVSVTTTSCIGMGDQGPAALVNNMPITRLTPDRVKTMADLIRQNVALSQWPSEFFAVDDNVRRKDVLLDTTLKPGDALAAAVKLGADGFLEQVGLSNLRGRGGAGFSTAQKWNFCRKAPVAEDRGRVIVCNADEGEPGTFKDRLLLTRYADLVFEGMTLAAFTVGAKQGFLYLRGEYRYLRPALEQCLADRRAANLLGNDILGQSGFNFDIQIHLGAGAYVCGEETALIESLEGKRGTPRIRPPFPVTQGYLGRPTAVNNVETLAKSCLIALHGGQWFAKIGTPQSTGTKLISVSGDCDRPGIYEFPFGVSLQTILTECGAHHTQAVQVGGASGVTLAPTEFDRKIAFEDVPTAGAFMVFDVTRDMFEVARNFVHFFAHESCGFCTPCRVGTSLLCGYLDKLDQGYGSRPDLAEIDHLNRILKSASHCGLGQAAANPILDGLKKFRPAYDRRMLHHDFEPAFNLDMSLERARQITGRDDLSAHIAEEHQ